MSLCFLSWCHFASLCFLSWYLCAFFFLVACCFLGVTLLFSFLSSCHVALLLGVTLLLSWSHFAFILGVTLPCCLLPWCRFPLSAFFLDVTFSWCDFCFFLGVTFLFLGVTLLFFLGCHVACFLVSVYPSCHLAFFPGVVTFLHFFSCVIFFVSWFIPLFALPPVISFCLRVYTMQSCMLTCTLNSYLSCALRMAQD